MVIAGRERDYFSGTSYLGLQNHPSVRHAAVEAIERWGMSTATSRGGYGEHPIFTALEQEARVFFDREAVLYYPSGYFSALVLAQGLRDRYECAFIDESSHYSVFEGLRAAEKPFHTFQHLNPQSLREALRRGLRRGERPLVFSDGVFPISGEISPILEYLAVLDEFPGGNLALDDAHAAGVLGLHGRGTLEYFSIEDPRCLSGTTLSKALGGYGGILPASAQQIGEIIRYAKVYGGASPPPLPIAAASTTALRIARCDSSLLPALRSNVQQARAGLNTLGWALEDSPVPILCLRARADLDLAYVKAKLFEDDICVAHVTNYSSTPPGGCLRIAIFANHSDEQIERLIAALRRIIP